MQKKDIDWSKLGFGYTPTDTVSKLIGKTVNGMKVR